MLLYDQAERAAHIDLDGVADDDMIDDYLSIDRVEGNALWFDGDIGSVKVSAAAAKLAQPGWQVNAVLAKHKGTWHLLEVGNVYP